MTKRTLSEEQRAKLELFEQLVATVPGLERKGATMPYTSLNGHMFSLLTPEGTLALRLPEPPRTEFLHKYQTSLVEQYGVVMKEYVAVPGALLARTRELSKYFLLSVEYVGGLKPKATKRKATGKAKIGSPIKKPPRKPRGSK